MSTVTHEQIQRITRALADPTRYEMLRRIYSSPETLNCGSTCTDLPPPPPPPPPPPRAPPPPDLIHVTKDGRFKRLTPRRDIWAAYLAHLQEI